MNDAGEVRRNRAVRTSFFIANEDQLLQTDQEKINQLIKEGLSIRVEKGDRILFQSVEPMLKPLLACLQHYGEEMTGTTVIDKIVGLAAAYLCIIAKVKRVLTPLASTPAQRALQQHGIELVSQRLVAQIMNRDNSAPCPMEKLAMNCSSPEEFLLILRGERDKPSST